MSFFSLNQNPLNVTRTGELSATAIFDTVELDNTEVSRATLHNIDFIEGLNLKHGDRIVVSKRNMIIPHIEGNLDKGTPLKDIQQAIIPTKCPCCGSELQLLASSTAEDSTIAPFCLNTDCLDRKVRQFEHFASRKAMNIVGLSVATLKRFIEAGLLNDKVDLYTLKDAVDAKTLRKKRDIIMGMEGFGERAFAKLIKAIDDSRNTTMERFLISMDIPGLGRTFSTILCKEFDYNLGKIKVAGMGIVEFDFSSIPRFGETIHNNIRAWFADSNNIQLWEAILANVQFAEQNPSSAQVSVDSPFAGRVIVATGSFETFTRDTINAQIEALGAKAGGSVSKKTDYLVAGDKAGSKKEKAEALGVTVLSEAEFRDMAGLV